MTTQRAPDVSTFHMNRKLAQHEQYADTLTDDMNDEMTCNEVLNGYQDAVKELRELARQRDDLISGIWEHIRDGGNLEELPTVLDLGCPDCGGEGKGYYEGDRFVSLICGLCGESGVG